MVSALSKILVILTRQDLAFCIDRINQSLLLFRFGGPFSVFAPLAKAVIFQGVFCPALVTGQCGTKNTFKNQGFGGGTKLAENRKCERKPPENVSQVGA